ncbi:hypothetical protein ACQZV8_04825 [Magnetococcales bacterium HHB-1]
MVNYLQSIAHLGLKTSLQEQMQHETTRRALNTHNGNRLANRHVSQSNASFSTLKKGQGSGWRGNTSLQQSKAKGTQSFEEVLQQQINRISQT